MGKTPFQARRSDCLWLPPEKLVLVTDESSPFFDPRVHWPVNSGMVKNMLYQMQGVLEPVIIAKVDGEPVVVDGRQRVNALRAANEMLTDQGAEPLQCPCILKRGSDSELFSMSLSLNEQRKQDSVSDKAAKAMRLLNQGYSYSDVSQVFGVAEQTIRRWETCKSPNPKKERQRGPRTKSEIRGAIDKAAPMVANVLRWVLREIEELPKGV